jgi:hypothetical protein
MSINSNPQHLHKIGKNFPSQKFFHLSSVPPLTPVINLYFQISSLIFVKIQNGPNEILRGQGETDSWKNIKSKISCQTPFNEHDTTKEKYLPWSLKIVLQWFFCSSWCMSLLNTCEVRCWTNLMRCARCSADPRFLYLSQYRCTVKRPKFGNGH